MCKNLLVLVFYPINRYQICINHSVWSEFSGVLSTSASLIAAASVSLVLVSDSISPSLGFALAALALSLIGRGGLVSVMDAYVLFSESVKGCILRWNHKHACDVMCCVMCRCICHSVFAFTEQVREVPILSQLPKLLDSTLDCAIDNVLNEAAACTNLVGAFILGFWLSRRFVRDDRDVPLSAFARLTTACCCSCLR